MRVSRRALVCVIIELEAVLCADYCRFCFPAPCWLYLLSLKEEAGEHVAVVAVECVVAGARRRDAWRWVAADCAAAVVVSAEGASAGFVAADFAVTSIVAASVPGFSNFGYYPGFYGYGAYLYDPFWLDSWDSRVRFRLSQITYPYQYPYDGGYGSSGPSVVIVSNTPYGYPPATGEAPPAPPVVREAPPATRASGREI